jgi:hypothetical protein
LPKSEFSLYTLANQNTRRARKGAPSDKRTGEAKNGLEQNICCVRFYGKWAGAARGESRTPLAIEAKPLKRLETAMGSYWKKLA